MTGAFNQKYFPASQHFVCGKIVSRTLRGCKDDADIPQLDVLLWYLTHITKTPGPSPSPITSDFTIGAVQRYK